ncbi:ABC transporter substrate-binding protein [Acuticoccus sp. M5D2P5]|uniref:ABC transporter substrate-binding protein n=1 Tax=Acuticoccus kalidii TaxID=2910977 RepID=UPI001F34EFCA|nr:ABC transporter substrate-binding protein [Acuticoccus kalidii]MCF3932112.1 ABC transporter substrate-binding protein [Acuticoccus kalidii]
MVGTPFTRRSVLLSAGATAIAGTLGLPSIAWSQSDRFIVGALNPVSGAGSPYGPAMQASIVMAADEINAAGGAAGRMIEVIGEDTQSAPDAAVTAAKKLIEVNKVDAILGTWSSGVSLAVMPLALAAGIPQAVTSGAPQISELDDKDLIWRFNASNVLFGTAFAKAAAAFGFERPATMAFNNASGIGNSEGFTEAWTADGGEVVAEVVYEPNRASYRSELQRVMSANPDVIVAGSYLPDTTILLREWYQLGGTNKWIIPGWAFGPQLVEALGPDVLEGVIVVDSISNESAASYDHYAKMFAENAGPNLTRSVYSTIAYDMMITFGLAIEAAGPGASIAEINAKIREVASPGGTEVFTFAEGKEALKNGDINYQGASSRLDFDEFGDAKPDFAAAVIRNGELVRSEVITL